MGLVAWMLIVMMMGAGIGRNSDTLELRELGGYMFDLILSCVRKCMLGDNGFR